MSNLYIPKSRIVEAACRRDFLSFFQWGFHVLEPGSTLNLSWPHYAMAYHLDLVLGGVIKRLAIVAPPRTLKSLMASVAFPAYVLGRNPTKRVIGISYGSDLQITFSNQCRAIIDTPRYQKLFPRTRLSKNTEAEFHTTLGGYGNPRWSRARFSSATNRLISMMTFPASRSSCKTSAKTSREGKSACSWEVTCRRTELANASLMYNPYR